MKWIKLFEEYLNNEHMILYHGSNKKIDNFELTKGYRTHFYSIEEVNSYAIFLTPDKNAALSYGNKYLYECSINCKRILDWSNFLDRRSASWIKKNFGNIIPYNSKDYWMLLDDEKIIQYLNHRGIDCIKLEESDDRNYDSYYTYAVLNPNNVKIENIIEL